MANTRGDYDIRVGIDTGRFKSFKDDIQKGLDELSREAKIYPLFESKHVEKEIKNIGDQIKSLNSIPLKLNDKEILGTIENLSVKLAETFSSTFKGSVENTVFDRYKNEVNEATEAMKNFKISTQGFKGIVNDISNLFKMGGNASSLASNLTAVADAYESLTKAFRKFDDYIDSEGNFTKLGNKHSKMITMISRLKKEAEKQPIKLKGQLNVVDTKETIDKQIEHMKLRSKLKIEVDKTFLSSQIKEITKNSINVTVEKNSKSTLTKFVNQIENVGKAIDKLNGKTINVQNISPTPSIPGSVIIDPSSMQELARVFSELIDAKKKELGLQQDITEEENKQATSSKQKAKQKQKELEKILKVYENNRDSVVKSRGDLVYNSDDIIGESNKKYIEKIDETLEKSQQFYEAIQKKDTKTAKQYKDELLTLVEELKIYKQQLKEIQSLVTKVDKDKKIFNTSRVELPEQEIETQIQKFNVAREKLLNHYNGSTILGDPAELQQAKIDLAEAYGYIHNIAEEAKKSDLQDVYDSKETNKLSKVSRDLVDILNKHTRELKKHPEIYERIIELQKKIRNGQIDSITANKEISSINRELDDLGITTETIWKKFKDTFGTRIKSALAGSGVFLIERALRQIYMDVVALDSAMTELRKVTNATESDYIRFLDNAEARAKALGATLTEVVNASADFARLGYDIDQASQLADAALIYLNVGDDVSSIDDASKAIISTMQGFGIEAKNVMSIIDKFNEVANNYASSAGDIGAITQRSAAAMKVAGSDLSEVIALGVTANEVVQDADVVGTAMKTMSMRLRGSKSDLEAAGEDVDGMAESTSVLRDEILALSGVDIMLDDKTFKTPYQMLMELGAVWDDISDIGKANIGELLFGKRQANIGFAILENYERAQQILETANNSAGSAMRENEIYLDSIQGRLDKLTASTQAFSSTALDSDAVKTVVSGLTTALDLVTQIVDKVGLLPTILAGVATLWAKDQKVGRECALLYQVA